MFQDSWKMKIRRPVVTAFVVGLFLLPAPIANGQKATSFDIAQWRDMLRNVKRELVKHYYDPNFHGMDPESRFKEADEKMKTAESMGQLVGILAQVLLDLNDSHTAFIPPYRSSRVEYGFLMKPVGDDCFVSAVKPDSDAEAQGLKPGDKLVSIDGRPLDRTKVWLAKYLYYTLRPQSSMTLVIEKPDGQQKQLTIQAEIRDGQKLISPYDRTREFDRYDYYRRTQDRFYEPNDDVLIWKMPNFRLSDHGVDHLFGKFKNRKALILDLRDNGGGYVVALNRLAGHFFNHDVKIADLKGRKKMDPQIAKGQKNSAFKGQLIVLIDGESSSASELFARVMQLEKRAVVIGDRSAGSVMRSRYHHLELGVIGGIQYGLKVTDADLIMADGKSLEHIGVTPDELVLPTPEDMATGRDPVLAHAASLVGVKLDPITAGKLFPMEWKRM